MKFKNSIYAVFFLLSPFIAHAENEGRFYAVTEAGQTKMTAPTTTNYSFTSNSWNVGLGYEQDHSSIEFTYGSAISLSSTYGNSTSDYDLSNYTFVYNYKLWNTGNFRPFVGLGRYGGTLAVTGQTDLDYAYSIFDAGLEVPLDDNSSIRFKYMKTYNAAGYTSFQVYLLGLMYRF